MKTVLPFLILAASCAGGRRIEQPAFVSLLGSEARLETWEVQAAEDFHLHPGGGPPCATPSQLRQLATPALPDSRGEAAAETVSALLEEAATLSRGPAYGGPGRLTLALRRRAPGREETEEALVVVVPSLGEDREEGSFEGTEIAAAYHRPPARRRAVPERGRVEVRRLAPGLYAFALFLVLKSPSSPPLQVAARADAGTAPAPGDIR